MDTNMSQACKEMWCTSEESYSVSFEPGGENMCVATIFCKKKERQVEKISVHTNVIVTFCAQPHDENIAL